MKMKITCHQDICSEEMNYIDSLQYPLLILCFSLFIIRSLFINLILLVCD